MEPMEGLMSKRTVIAVTHDLDTVRRADLILVLDAGQIVERGTHEELLRMGARYAGLYTDEGWVDREHRVGVEAGESVDRPISRRAGG
jgi:ABC-type multidrug transport system fused ATPase/permease subunit